MRQPATIDGPDRVDRRTGGERELARALELLQRNNVRPVTAAALRSRGVRAPAQAVYDLQLAGYPIDRVTAPDPRGHMTPAPPELERMATAPELADDHDSRGPRGTTPARPADNPKTPNRPSTTRRQRWHPDPQAGIRTAS